MVAICFYFQLHQPFRLNNFRVQQIGSHDKYFDEAKNAAIFKKVANNCYWPAGKLLLKLLKQHAGSFKVSFSMSGTFLEQCGRYDPSLLALYQEIMRMDGAELLCETSHHSLAALADTEEFERQVRNHRRTLLKTFHKLPTVFRNTELIYSNSIGELVAKMEFKGCILEGWDPYVPRGWTPHHLFEHPSWPRLKLLPKSYRLSDDIAFRFSDRNWPAWPLTAEKYIRWLENLLDGENEFVGLFMDYETFGEHQWNDTGIFDFLEEFSGRIVQHPELSFVTPSEAVENLPARAPMSVPVPLSWADTERDVSAWLSNRLQEEAFAKIYSLKSKVMSLRKQQITEVWRKLQTSDHFYYMCIKYSHDGDVHKYFSPFESSYEAYIDYFNVVDDFSLQLDELLDERRKLKSRGFLRGILSQGLPFLNAAGGKRRLEALEKTKQTSTAKKHKNSPKETAF